MHIPSPSRPRWLRGEFLLVWLVFAVHAAWPVPDVNEAHYLCKAKHFWNPGWIEGDVFLESADIHYVFYVTCGWPTQWLSLPLCAWVGRLLVWLFLAWCWTRLVQAVFPVCGWATLTAALVVAGIEHAHLAGEWLVGGLEAKVPAYGFVFLALECVVRRRWRLVWIELGVASAFHVLVGGWSTIAVCIAWLVYGRRQASLGQIWPAVLAGGAIALVGVVPALWAVPQVTAEISREANEIYVFRRLAHHLFWPWFPEWYQLRFVLLFLLWNNLLWLNAWLRRSRPDCTGARRSDGVQVWVAGTLLIALGGFLLPYCLSAEGALLPALLKLYWFRLADIALPLGVALAAAQTLLLLRHRIALHRAVCGLLVLLAVAHLGNQVALRVIDPVPRSFRLGDAQDYRDWRAACDWVRDQTPADARFLTPKEAVSFKWHTGRAEVANWKDVPQDAPGVLEWWQRMLDLHYDADGQQWLDSLAERNPRDLRRLGEKYDASFLVTRSKPPLDLPRVFPPEGESAFVVYRLDGWDER